MVSEAIINKRLTEEFPRMMSIVHSDVPEEEKKKVVYQYIDILKELDETDEFGECSTNNLKIDSLVSNLKEIKMGSSDDYDLDF